ncbi:enoyl-CoA hydratase-related protein [Phaeovulum sp. W22_SRMD_FR3]|uniref:enoyl-CoA hydratase-related protein n=1 Tax=Phaeovulum sp. W22_SRMD_FR3 TaxID=3240274 RepID=UPI003F9E7A02
MVKPVKVHLRDGVVLITLNPAGAEPQGTSGFDSACCASLSEALAGALAEPAARALVLRAGPGGWPLARDPLTEDGAALDRLALMLATAQKPVLAALSGRIAGGSLALAQAVEWRIAAADVRFSAPTTALGLMPPGGLLTRLSRRIGPAPALRFLLNAGGWDGAQALAAGMIDGSVEATDVELAALNLAKRLTAAQAPAGAAADAPAPPPAARARDAALADPAAYLKALSQMRETLPEGVLRPVALALADGAEAAALLPETAALEAEAVFRGDLADSPLAAALCHQAAARRRAKRLAGHADAPGFGPGVIALWHGGAGQGAGGAAGVWQGNARRIAAVALSLASDKPGGAGRPVRLGAADAGQLISSFEEIARAQEAAVQEGRLSVAAREAAWAHLEPARLASDLRGNAAAGEEPPVMLLATLPDPAPARVSALGALAAALPQGAPLVVLDAAVDPGRLAPLLAGRGGDVVGLRLAGTRLAAFGAPSQVGEVVVGPETRPEAAEAVAALLTEMGVTTVLGGPGPGGILRRMRLALMLAAEGCVLAGATPAAVDGALRAAGCGEGPFEALDRQGLERAQAQAEAIGRPLGRLVARLMAERWLGRRAREDGQAARGFYPSGGRGVTLSDGDPALERVLAELRPAQPMADKEIMARILAALAGEGAALLQQGGAHRASDIDLVMVEGLGFPRALGGPMLAADRAGLIAIRKRLRALAAEGAPAPVTLWDVLIKNGRKFGDLNEA